MRLPYAPATAPSDEPATTSIYERIAARRSPRPLQALDLTLLRAPPVADGWNSFLGAIRTQTSLAADVREIAICRVAALNGATYEWEHHAPLARQAGVSEHGVAVLGSDMPDVMERLEEGTKGPAGTVEGLSERQWAVVRYTDAMTRDIRVGEGVFADLRRYFEEREVVEITATIAAYNCVSRFLVALDVGEKNAVPTTTASTHPDIVSP